MSGIRRRNHGVTSATATNPSANDNQGKILSSLIKRSGRSLTAAQVSESPTLDSLRRGQNVTNMALRVISVLWYESNLSSCFAKRLGDVFFISYC